MVSKAALLYGKYRHAHNVQVAAMKKKWFRHFWLKNHLFQKVVFETTGFRKPKKRFRHGGEIPHSIRTDGVRTSGRAHCAAEREGTHRRADEIPPSVACRTADADKILRHAIVPQDIRISWGESCPAGAPAKLGASDTKRSQLLDLLWCGSPGALQPSATFDGLREGAVQTA